MNVARAKRFSDINDDDDDASEVLSSAHCLRAIARLGVRE